MSNTNKLLPTDAWGSIVLLQCGIGKVAAAVGAVELIRRYQPDCIINTGVAGALSSAVDVMDVVAAARTVYHDVDCFTDNPHGCIQGFPLFFESDKRFMRSEACSRPRKCTSD